jgi:hypothetical protein
MRRAAAAGTAVLATLSLAAGCQERVCRRGEHAVRSVEAPDTGRACVKNGEPPPAGYEEYPPGEVPVHVD